ncbi:MAG: lipocalin-like domain-containing protein [Acidobacteriota bacterium]
MKRFAFVAALLLLAVPFRPRAQQPAPFSPADLVGTWTLDVAEPAESGGGRGGDEAATAGRGGQADAAGRGRGGGGGGGRGANLKGLLIFDGAGHAFEMITRASMAQPTGATQALTESQLRFAGSGGFWGSYKADGQTKAITFKAEGAVSPNMMGREFTRSFEVAGDRLTVTYTGAEHYAPAGTRWTFARVPTVDNVGPTYRKVLGFWQHVVEKRVNLTTGMTLSETRRAPSIIVYTASGYVGVHFPPLNRPRFAADAPTDAEARAALQGYVGYFGALSVYPNMVFHQILTGISFAGGTTLKRPLEMSGDEVTIKFPPTTNQQGQQTSTHVTLRRLSGEAAMIPARDRVQ